MRRKSDQSYRQDFDSAEKAYRYDMSQYSNGTYGDLLWRIEQARLHALVEEFRITHRTVDYLDFATGTGRIISFMEDLVDTATGIEISEAMAKLAVSKVKRAKIVCCDITEPGTHIEAQYDFITAFRFLLNAEPSLRLAALKALAARLRDRTSWLVFNNHGYLWSYRLLAYPYFTLRTLTDKGLKVNYLTYRAVAHLADQASLQIDRVIGCGLFSGKVAGMMSFDTALKWEEWVGRNVILSRLGVNQLYIARLK